jgi:uncharacterized LabA/DUF88 family protein
MPAEPAVKRTVAFLDGQNLYHAARAAFGHVYPNYDPPALATAVCARRGWTLIETRFYTGIPDASDDAFWNHFWKAKLRQMSRSGVLTYARALSYRKCMVVFADGSTGPATVAEEKGIDVRIAIDVIRLAHRRAFDVALLFSQDQDLSEVADEIRVVAREQDRWIKIASAFPVSPTLRNARGVNKTDWIPIDHATYGACLDRRDYRPKEKTP